MQADFEYTHVRLWNYYEPAYPYETAGHPTGVLIRVNGGMPILVCGASVDIYNGPSEVELSLPCK